MVGPVIVPHRRRARRNRSLFVRAIVISFIASLTASFITIRGCKTVTVPEGREQVTVAGEHFFLEPALNESTRIRGLGGRQTIEPTGGMVFVFANRIPLQFVMRDCLTPIDIAYLDDSGRIVRMYEMPIEDPQGPDEPQGDYENRLPRYNSDFPVRYVIEVAPGTWKRLGVKPGDQFELDLDGLKARAR